MPAAGLALIMFWIHGIGQQYAQLSLTRRPAPPTVAPMIFLMCSAQCSFSPRVPRSLVAQTLLKNLRTTYERGTRPLKPPRAKHIKNIIGAKAETPEAANHLLKVLRIMLAYAVDQGMIANNPASGVKKFPSQGDGHHSWSEAEIAQYKSRHPVGSKARLALVLGLRTGQRKGDVLRMGWQHVTGEAIAVRQEKTATALIIPMHPELKAALASLPRTNLTFLMTEWGAPFTSAGFGNWFRDRCNEAGLKHCSFHGLRKAAATRLANAGCSTDQVKAITGHRSLAEVARYTKAADQQRLARQALDIQLKTEGEQNFVQPSIRLDKIAK